MDGLYARVAERVKEVVQIVQGVAEYFTWKVQDEKRVMRGEDVLGRTVFRGLREPYFW